MAEEVTPDDVTQAAFREQRRGYDTSVVDALLARVAEELRQGRSPVELIAETALPSARHGYDRDQVDALLARLTGQETLEPTPLLGATSSSTSDGDPGWGSTREVVLSVLLLPVAARRGSDNGLVGLRVVTVTFVGALVLFAGVIIVVLPGGDARRGMSVSLAAALAVAFGFASHVVARVVPHALDCRSDEALAGSYRTRFFLRVAFIDAAALVGFVLSFLADSAAPYLCSLPIALLGFAWVAPSRSRVARDQEELSLGGCGRSLAAALQAPSAGAR